MKNRELVSISFSMMDLVKHMEVQEADRPAEEVLGWNLQSV